MSADAFDVMFDILYAEPNENHVNFGAIKMGVESNQFMKFQFKGKHQFAYK